MNKKLIEIEIDLTDDEFLTLARLAHEKNITFNELVIETLTEYTEKLNGTSNDS